MKNKIIIFFLLFLNVFLKSAIEVKALSGNTICTIDSPALEERVARVPEGRVLSSEDPIFQELSKHLPDFIEIDVAGKERTAIITNLVPSGGNLTAISDLLEIELTFNLPGNSSTFMYDGENRLPS